MRHAIADNMRHATQTTTVHGHRWVRQRAVHIGLIIIFVALGRCQAAAIVKNDIDASHNNDIGNVTKLLLMPAVTSTTPGVPIEAITLLPNDISAVATTVNFTVTTKTSTLPVPKTILASTTPTAPTKPETHSPAELAASSTLASALQLDAQPKTTTAVPAALAETQSPSASTAPVASSTQLPASSAAPVTVTKPYRGSTTFMGPGTTTNRSAKVVSNAIVADTGKKPNVNRHIERTSVATPLGVIEPERLADMLNKTVPKADVFDSTTSTTEDYHFDLSHYTSAYGINHNNQIESSLRRIESPPSAATANQHHTNESNSHDENVTAVITTAATLVDPFSNIADNQIGNFSAPDYERKFDEIVLTTPETLFFDKIHKQYEQDKMLLPEIDGAVVVPFDGSSSSTASNSSMPSAALSQQNDRAAGSSNLFDTIDGNTMAEKNSSRYYNNADMESTSYDFSANEIHNSTHEDSMQPGANATTEKRGKYLLDPFNKTSSGSNQTIPNTTATTDVRSVATQKMVNHQKFMDGQMFDITTSILKSGEPDIKKTSNGTMVTKQLADWVEVMKHQDFTNSSFGSDANVNGTLLNIIDMMLPKKVLANRDSASQENQIIAIVSDPTTTTTTTETPRAATANRLNLTRNADMTNASIFIPVMKASQHLLHKEKNGLDSLTTPPTVIGEDEALTVVPDDDTTVDNAVTNESENGDTADTGTEYVVSDHHTQTDTADEEEVVSTTTITTVQEDVHVPTKIPTEVVTNVKPNDMTTNENDPVSTMPPTVESITLPITTDTPTTSQPNESIESNLVVKTSESVQKAGIIATTPKVLSSIRPLVDDENNNNDEDDDGDLQFTTIVIDQDNENGGGGGVGHEDWDIVTTTTQTIGQAIILKPDVHVRGGSHEGISGEDDDDDSDNIMMEPKMNENATEHIADTAHLGGIGGGFKSTTQNEPDVNAIIAISVSVVGVVCVVLLVGFLFVMRKRQKQLTYAQRCRPVGLDAYSLDNVSVYNSVRRKGVLRQSKRAYGNAAFDDPALQNNVLTSAALAAFVGKRHDIYDEFKELPTVTARVDEVPAGCEVKNRYANIVPLPETRVYLKRINNDEKTEYINANFVKGPKDTSQYYIACQAPLDHTVTDFWRMIWEQNSRVIIMATDLSENGHEKCAEYLPPSVVLDNHIGFGDFQVTLKSREVKEKYAVSTVHLKNTETNTWRELTHLWYQWPDTGVPSDEATMVAMLLEARSYLKMALPEQADEHSSTDVIKEIDETGEDRDQLKATDSTSLDKSKSLPRFQGPLTVHCSPGTGRTGTIIACDIALRALEQPPRSVDIPQIVYFVRSGRASAVRTREQYEFIYKVAHIYATKLTAPIGEN